MNEGDVIVASLPQADGKVKQRPVVVLAKLPPFGDLLTVGVSTQTQMAVPGFDEVVDSHHVDFVSSGLKRDSVIRLSFVSAISPKRFCGRIGRISPDLLKSLRNRLADLGMAGQQLPSFDCDISLKRPGAI